jgi:hypothetical protein
MIHEVAKEIGVLLKARGCPIPVVDGPEQTTPTGYARERIVVEHDEDAGDGFSPVKGSFVNPVPRAIRDIGVKVTIYTQHPELGAMPFEHRRRAEHALDMFIVALFEVAAVRRNAFNLTGGKFVQPIDLKTSEKIGGAVYELKFTIDRGIRQLTWQGEKRPEATLDPETGVKAKSKTNVALANGAEDAPVETGCGG